MAHPRRVVLIGAALALLVVVVAVAGLAIRRQLRYGTIADQETASITVDVGDRFSLRVPDRGPSVGDRWSASADPADLVEQVGDELVSDSLGDRLFGPALGGGGGFRFFRFDAKQAGRATITLSNCFQGCHNERTRSQSTTTVWTVTIS
ncbi:protease inhibitor I42 family protein [Plantactinospora sp. WMMC1484]|uniref:protease inhibitor I42 family protein n=1 Tax=Plantactinospora sp. WMMC1484 TaxID=3404122 RepID=UPI003BF4A9F3